MMAQFITCFGWWGVLSALAWLAAVVACAACLRQAPRRRRFAWALGLAAAGFLLAKVQTAWERAIVLDRSDELRAVREAQQDLQMREERARIAQGENVMRFAEDAPGESAGGVILTADELTGRTAAPAATNAAASYRAAGKQTRTAGKVDAAAKRLARAAAETGPAAAPTVRTLRLDAYRLAGRLSRANRLLADLALLAVLGIAIGDYLLRFHHPVNGYLPLPIAGTWLTHLSHGPPLVSWPGASEAQLRAFLEDVARRGQTFLYVGDRFDPGCPILHRIRWGRLRVWPLQVLTWGRGGAPADAEFALDAVWFDRYALIVPSAEAGALLPPLLKLLAGRAAVQACAARLPHLVWDADAPADAASWRRLAALCARTGLRLVAVAARLPDERTGAFLIVKPEEKEQP